jgi:transcriptional regulator with XRE-family HTH domain
MDTQPRDFRQGLAVPYLRAWRAARVLTQDELAAKAGVSVGTISAGEHGRPIQIPNIARLAKALGVDRVALVRTPPEATQDN